MRHVTVGVFHDESLATMLGKKGTCSDIMLCNRKSDDLLITFMSAVDEKLTPKVEILSEIDCALVWFDGKMTVGLGETLVLLDCLGVTKGCFVVPPYTDVSGLNGFINDLSVRSFEVRERDEHKLVEFLEGIEPIHADEGGTSVIVDHSFSVKGVGEIVLGVVCSGTVKHHQKLILYPGKKEIVVRSIQMQDHDVESAPCGGRVGLAIKGAKVEEMRRGCILAEEGVVRMAKDFDCVFEKSAFYKDAVEAGWFHIAVGMSVVPVNILSAGKGRIRFEADRDIAFHPDDRLILLNLNSAKLHVMGVCIP